MAVNEILKRQHAVLNRLSQLPRKMLALKDQGNITEFVLHELCHTDCFDLEKAAYFIDNPDFDCLKGVAGVWRPEVYTTPNNDIWQNPSLFTAHMQGSLFNQKVRDFIRPSLRKSKESDEEIVRMIGQELHMQNPGYYAWDMKHDNHGLLIYEKPYKTGDACDIDMVLNGLSLLSFCPIF
ncbi:MAG TPA: hypothetical protein PLU71_01150 [Candidatus Dependentiae bacterium]|nr:hypothetical protein [Candidatus Dependentiae bacterium]HRQ62437.1 hypothetical protein [Candidatus Dependentiae bacterium]